MTDDSSVEFFSTPKLNMDGDGDGIKNVTARKRTPVPSSKKFNARTPCDEKMRIKLEKTLMEMQSKESKPKSHCCLIKSQSVAEITPSKSKPKKKPIPKLQKLNLSGDSSEHDTSSLSVTLHATPRPLEAPLATSTSSASRRCCTRDWAACKVYGRLMLCVWRRYKARLQAMSESNGRQQNQISQLELQVDFLKNMRNSECDKRNEALNECQRLKKKMEILELANNNLIEEIKSQQEELMGSKKNIRLVKFDLKKSSEELIQTKDLLKRRKEEKMDLLSKLATQEKKIYNQNSTISDLENALTISENNLHNIESNFRSKQDEFDEICQQLEAEMKLNEKLKTEISCLKNSNVLFQNRSKHLEDELESYISHIEELKEENTSIRIGLEQVATELSVEKKRPWYKNTKELALLSLSALQKIAEVVLPVYHKY